MTQTIDLRPGAATLPDENDSTRMGASFTEWVGTEADPKKFFDTLLFGAAWKARAWWTFRLPDDYASGGTLKILWMSNVTSGNVKWQAKVSATTPGDADTPIEHAAAAFATVTTGVNATEAYRLVESSITLTMDSAAAGDLIILQIHRDPTDGSDTAAGEAHLLMASVTYA